MLNRSRWCCIKRWWRWRWWQLELYCVQIICTWLWSDPHHHQYTNSQLFTGWMMYCLPPGLQFQSGITKNSPFGAELPNWHDCPSLGGEENDFQRFRGAWALMGSSCWDCWAIVEGLQFNECPSECGSVAEWLGHWTCDSNPALLAIACTPRQVVNTRVRLSSSSITWY